MRQQLVFFVQDVKRLINKRKTRILYIWMSRVFIGLLLYRLERSMYLIFRKYYSIIRVLVLPLINIIQIYSNFDIHFTADIKGGFKVLHPSMGVVIAGHSIIGYNLTLTGGNVIGINKKFKMGEFVIGDNCTLGANAVIIGPILLGNKITIGASACVVKSYVEDGVTLVGVPAKCTIIKE